MQSDQCGQLGNEEKYMGTLRVMLLEDLVGRQRGIAKTPRQTAERSEGGLR
jgi:hypothetical protein